MIVLFLVINRIRKKPLKVQRILEAPKKVQVQQPAQIQKKLPEIRKIPIKRKSRILEILRNLIRIFAIGISNLFNKVANSINKIYEKMKERNHVRNQQRLAQKKIENISIKEKPASFGKPKEEEILIRKEFSIKDLLTGIKVFFLRIAYTLKMLPHNLLKFFKKITGIESAQDLIDEQ